VAGRTLKALDQAPSPLIDYIAAAKAQGASDSFLVEMLERNGWPRKEILAAFSVLYTRLTGLDTPRRVSGLTDSARDAFLYLLSFGTLGVWTLGLGSLFFTLIEIWYADPIFQQRYAPPAADALSGPMASIIIGFPVYLITMTILLRDLDRKPDKAGSGVRKWLTYIALLISASTVIGDLVTFVDYFLRGQFAMPFLLKVTTVLVIAGGVFWYYLVPMEKREAQA
jgi:hypothetical protein